MREIITYDNYKNNLCSIKSVEHNFSGRLYLSNLLRRLVANFGVVFYVNALRPYYEVDVLNASIKTLRNKLCDLKVSDDLFEISFHVVKTQLDDVVLQSIVNIWFEYEQPFFVIVEEKEALNKVLKLLENKFIKWSDVTESVRAYVLYRGAEEDVVWIGKNTNLEFEIE